MLFCSATPLVRAAWAPNDLTIIDIKMTGSESIVIENTSPSSINLQNYLVEYFNKSNPTSLALPSSTQQLPNMVLDPQEAILLNGDNASTCGAKAVANLSFSLSDTNGYLAVMRVDTESDGSLLYKPQDRLSWTSTSSGADILKVPSSSVDPQAVWFRKLSDGAWQQAELSDNCAVLIAMIAPSSDPSFVQWSIGDEPLATFISNSTGSNDQNAIPASDLGLSAPMITELLPNPAEPQSDSEDEFIELYNPNDEVFDLTGFKLEIGTSTKHFYTFPAGTSIAPKGFVAFYSVDTSLNLSNNGSQAWLLDPLGTIISQTDAYTTAKDGQSWALASGEWRWTTTPTAASSNIITDPLTVKTLSLGGVSSSSSKKSTTPKVKAAKASKKASTKQSVTSNSSPTSFSNADSNSPIHPLTLAIVGALAVVYAVYEYRNDLGGYLHRLRRYREARRTAGK